MGVIRKKTATRGTEGGTKYHCDVCSVDITSTVSHDGHVSLAGRNAGLLMVLLFRFGYHARTLPAMSMISAFPVSPPARAPRTMIPGLTTTT